MTHFIGAVIVPKDIPIGLSSSKQKFLGSEWTDITPDESLEDYLNTALAPFDENMEYEAWIPKAEVIAKGRQRIQEYTESQMYTEFQEDPEKYAAEHSGNPAHVEYLRTEFPKKLAWTDEEVWADYARDEEPEDIREDGAIRTRYNPKSKWDWWTIGGRWESQYRDKQGMKVSEFLEELVAKKNALVDPVEVQRAAIAQEAFDATEAGRWSSATPEQVKAREDAWEALLACPAFVPWSFPYNLIVPRQVPKVTEDEAEYDADGNEVLMTSHEWVEKGSMGWWGMHTDSFGDSEWIEVLISELSLVDPDDKLVYIDFHI